ncbi:hypothetical protein A3715_34085 [Oleiphilus sp. HI0009]|nr:hypothetical protein A3715_10000 [Oleiphilus sp. HI0009]KZX82423.1 hypothetical protein A3715_34085 [Oleiphilus sp. HI0009]
MSKDVPLTIILLSRDMLKVVLRFLLSTVVWVSVAHAHPHSWIDVQTTLTLDADGNLIEITQLWEFDEVYSRIALETVTKEYENEMLGLEMLAQDMVTNLKPYKYFSSLQLDKIDIPLSKPVYAKFEPYSEQGKLKLKQIFAFDTPVKLAGQAITWSVFDPTYYVAMNHHSADAVNVIANEKTRCAKQFKLPSPTQEDIDYAASLDQTQRDSDGLGQLFSERVTIQCN